MKTDSQIQQDVLWELKWEPRLQQAHVAVRVDEGTVMLIGVVSSQAQRLAAQEAARRVSGVLDLANAVEVRGVCNHPPVTA